MEQVRIFKNYLENQNITIRDWLEFQRNPEESKEENRIYCNNCHLNSDAKNSEFLVYGPNVLIVNLNRGKGIQYKIKKILNSIWIFLILFLIVKAQKIMN